MYWIYTTHQRKWLYLVYTSDNGVRVYNVNIVIQENTKYFCSDCFSC